MDMTVISQFIGSLGFPIVACIGMFFLYSKTLKSLTESINQLATKLDKLPCMKGGDCSGNQNQ